MIDEKVIEGLREYLKDHYTPSHGFIGLPIVTNAIAGVSNGIPLTKGNKVAIKAVSLRNISDEASEYIKKHRKPGGFSHALDRKRKEKGLSPAELYKKANVDRKLYSKYMGPERKHPSTNTVISFALALHLERTEFDEFLQTAGYSLSNASSRDVCIMYCLEKGIYDIDDVNALLFAVGIDPLSKDSSA
jgi:transcriptional regulator with XRE-family HTH domain